MRLFSKKSAAPDETLEALRGEYQNYRRRTAAQLERAEADGMKKAVLALLPVYDDLARALDAPCTDEAYYHGVELLMQKLLARLDGLGVMPMDSLGKCFNPDYHEALSTLKTRPNARTRSCRSFRRASRWMKWLSATLR